MNNSNVSPKTPYELYIEYETLFDVIERISEALQEPIIANALVSLEITAAIFEKFYQDSRNAIDKKQSLERVGQCFADQFHLIARCCQIQTFNCPTVRSFSMISFPSKLHLLSDISLPVGNKIAQSYEMFADEISYCLGFELQIGLDCKNTDKPIIDYNMLQPIIALHRKNLQHQETAEDYFFCIIHQITECWLNIFHILANKAKQALLNSAFIEGKDIIVVMNAILDFLTKNTELLDLMVHKDYHPLRVRLRDASGSQSVGARNLRIAITQLAKTFQANLEQSNLTLLAMLMGCEKYSDKYTLFSSLLKLIGNYRSFLLKHFILASNTIGQNTIGSLGYEVNQLASSFLKPLVPEFEQALYDFTVLTNFQHSDVSGEIVMQRYQEKNPDFYRFDIESCVLSRETMQKKAIAYFDFFENKKIDAWLAMFDSTHCQLKDHLTSKPYVGIDQVRNFVKTLLSTITEMHYTLSNEKYTDNSITVAWEATVTMYNEKVFKFSGDETLVFNPEYLIVAVEISWSAADVYAQLIAPASTSTSTVAALAC